MMYSFWSLQRLTLGLIYFILTTSFTVWSLPLVSRPGALVLQERTVNNDFRYIHYLRDGGTSRRYYTRFSNRQPLDPTRLDTALATIREAQNAARYQNYDEARVRLGARVYRRTPFDFVPQQLTFGLGRDIQIRFTPTFRDSDRVTDDDRLPYAMVDHILSEIATRPEIGAVDLPSTWTATITGPNPGNQRNGVVGRVDIYAVVRGGPGPNTDVPRDPSTDIAAVAGYCFLTYWNFLGRGMGRQCTG